MGKRFIAGKKTRIRTCWKQEAGSQEPERGRIVFGVGVAIGVAIGL
jgi:hypothetical protein